MSDIDLIIDHLLDERGIVGRAGQQDDVQLEPVFLLWNRVRQVAEDGLEVFHIGVVWLLGRWSVVLSRPDPCGDPAFRCR